MIASHLAPVFFVLSLCPLAASQTQAPIYAYRAFSVVDQPNLEQALNRNGAAGYRLVGLSSGMNGNITAVMETASPARSYQYKVIFGAWAHLRIVHNNTPIVELLNEAGRQGFRFVPDSVLPSKGDVSAAVVVERVPDSAARYEYRVYSPQFPTAGKFERDFAAGQKEGFSLVFYGTAGRGLSTLMEKQDQASRPGSAEAGEYRRFECAPGDLLKRLREEVGKGYIPFAVSPWNDFSVLRTSFWLQRTAEPNLRVVSFESRPGAEISLLRDSYEGLANELNKVSAEGYSLVGVPIISRHMQGAFLPKYAWTLTAVTSQHPGKSTYRLVAGDSLPELNAQINTAADEGFRVIPGSFIAETAVLLERCGAPAK